MCMLLTLPVSSHPRHRSENYGKIEKIFARNGIYRANRPMARLSIHSIATDACKALDGAVSLTDVSHVTEEATEGRKTAEDDANATGPLTGAFQN